jgi:hypothetical protein
MYFADAQTLVGSGNSTQQPSIIKLDEDNDPQSVKETPKEELSTFCTILF